MIREAMNISNITKGTKTSSGLQQCPLIYMLMHSKREEDLKSISLLKYYLVSPRSKLPIFSFAPIFFHPCNVQVLWFPHTSSVPRPVSNARSLQTTISATAYLWCPTIIFGPPSALKKRLARATFPFRILWHMPAMMRGMQWSSSLSCSWSRNMFMAL